MTTMTPHLNIGLPAPKRAGILLAITFLLLAGCSSAEPAPTITRTPTQNPATIAALYTPIPTAASASTATLTPSVTPTASDTPRPTVTFVETSTPAPTFTPSEAPAAVGMSEPTQLDHYLLRRPILRDATNENVDWIDRTYPYGGTQFGTREVHRGVEFVNTRFTTIYAAADGVVLYAGTDEETQVGPELNYYGNVVVIQHAIMSPEGLPVFTLYGHLQDFSVQSGQAVRAGDEIARVGDSGIAIGPHVHFEVRVGDGFDYRATRNPELWLRPYPEFGTLAGLVTDNAGQPLHGVVMTVRAGEFSREIYSYGDESVNSDAAWGENFTLGDIPVGEYEVIISNGNGQVRFRDNVTIENGVTTWLPIVLDE